jgi:hypothetical protein
MIFEVEISDGVILEYAANIIAESLYVQVDAEGHQYVLRSEIVDHRKESDATSKDDEFVSRNGKPLRRMTT